MTFSTEVLIVGGGLAGLRLADLLTQTGRDFVLIDRRNRLGGRILGHMTDGQTFDLGPAWYWPGQPRMAELVARFALPVFDQFERGVGLFENAQGQIQNAGTAGSMRGSLRLEGGMQSLCDALASGLRPDRIRVNTPLLSCTKTTDGVEATCGDLLIRASHLVLAIPPRIAATVDWEPALPHAALRKLENTPTWMAGQAKAIAFYEHPFWRDAGLSGDAMSQRGPMVEIHDASPARGGPAALFGFIGLTPAQRQDQAALKQAIRAQLIRLFGPMAAPMQDLVLKDWAHDPATATLSDQAPLYTHPTYGLAPELHGLWDGKITFGATEVAPHFGGYLEGALEAAEQAFRRLTDSAGTPACA